MKQSTLPRVLILVLCAVGLTGCKAAQNLLKINPGGPGVEWTVNDECVDGQDVQYRFYRYPSGSDTHDGVWPSETTVWETTSGRESTHRLKCSSGTGRICLGAQVTGGGSRYWGVGIAADKGCTGCCSSCPTSGFTHRSNAFRCSSG